MEQFIYNYNYYIMGAILFALILLICLYLFYASRFSKRIRTMSLLTVFVAFSLAFLMAYVWDVDYKNTPQKIKNYYGDVILEFTDENATVNKKNTLISTVDKKEYTIENSNTITTVKILLEKKPVAETLVENGTLKILYSDQEVATLNIKEDSRAEQQKILKNSK